MPKLMPEDLDKIAKKHERTIWLREGKAKAKVTVHMGTCGIAAGARKIMSRLLNLIEEKDIKDIIVANSGCAGLCSREPMITVELKDKPPVKYVDLNEEKVETIFQEHLLNGKIVKEYALAMGSEQLL